MKKVQFEKRVKRINDGVQVMDWGDDDTFQIVNVVLALLELVEDLNNRLEKIEGRQRPTNAVSPYDLSAIAAENRRRNRQRRADENHGH